MSLVRNGLSNSAVIVVAAVVALLLTPAMLWHLGVARYGTWTLAASLVGCFGLLDLGVSSALMRYVPVLRGEGNAAGVNCMVSTGLAFFTFVGALICVAVWGSAECVAAFFDGGAELTGLMRLIGIATLFQMPAVILSTAVKGHERFIFANSVTIISVVLRGGLLWGCILLGYGLVSMGWVLVIVGVATLAGQAVAFRCACPEVALRIGNVRLGEFRQLLGLGGLILGISIASTVGTEGPKLIAAKLISLEALGLLSVPLLVINYYRQLMFAFTRVFVPRVGYLAGRAAGAELRDLFLQGSRYMAILATLIALGLWCLGPSFVAVWTGKESFGAAFPALLVLSVGNLFYLSGRLSWDVLFGLGRQRRLVAFEMAEAIGVCGLGIALCGPLGITGVALGLALPAVVVRGVLQPVSACRHLGVPLRTFYINCILKPWAPALVLAGAFGWLRADPYSFNWATLILAAFVLAAAYLAMAWRFSIAQEERREVLDRIRSACARGFGFKSWV